MRSNDAVMVNNNNNNLPQSQGVETEDASLALRALQERPTQTMGCNPFESQEFFTTDLQVSYEIFTDEPIQDDFGESLLAQKLPLLVQGASVETLHHTLCAIGLDESTGRKPSTVVRLAQCMYSITASQHEEMTFCTDAENEPNCVAFAGVLKLFHAVDCADDIELAALLGIEQGVQQVSFVESINRRLTRFDNHVVQVVVSENGHARDGGVAAATSAAMATTDRKISPGGYVMIALAGGLLLLLFALLFVQQRHQRRRRRALDEKSTRTDTTPDESYITADFGNLALQHSKNDVHRCDSALCPVCMSNPDDIQMVQIPKDQPTFVEHPDLASSYLESYMRGYEEDDYTFEAEGGEEGIETIAQEEVPVEIGFRRKRRRFPLFRKKPPAVALESVSFVRVASAQRLDEDDVAETSQGLSVAL